MYVLYYCIFINNAYKTINSDENVLYGISKMNIYYIYINIYPHTIECGVPNNGGRKTLDGNFNRQRRQPTFSTHGHKWGVKMLSIKRCGAWLLFLHNSAFADFVIVSPDTLAGYSFGLTASSVLYGKKPGYLGLYNLSYTPSNLCNNE